MIASFSFMMWALALAVPAYWALPGSSLRLLLLCAVSSGFLFLLSPLILLTVLLYLVILAGFVALRRSGKIATKRLKTLSWGVFLPLVLVEFIPADLLAAGILGQEALEVPILAAFAFLGISYTAIRTFLLIREDIEGKGATPLQAVLTLVFFGSFVAGPIAGGAPYKNIAPRLDIPALFLGLARIGWGCALFIVVKPMVVNFDIAGATGAEGRLLAWLELYRNFLALYIDFTGYSDIAIGTALLFGITLPENFRWPLRATSIQEFWQRWHLSLGAFIGTYLFKPLVRKFGKPARAIFVAFIVVGLWHALTLPYFLWGIGHGAALALNMILRKSVPVKTWPKPLFRLNQLGGWAFTISYVALLSNFANQASMGDAMALLARLF